MADTSNTIKNRIQNFGNQLGQVATDTVETVVAVADDVGNRAKEFVTDATQRAETAGAYISQRADEATVAVGSRLKAAGEASESMGHSLKQTGDHLQRDGLQGLCADLSMLIRNHPIPAMLMGIGLGFVTARAMYRHE